MQWTLYFDRSGRLAEGNQITIAGVAVPQEKALEVRVRLQGMPKWKCTDFKAAAAIQDVVKTFQLPCAILPVDLPAGSQWTDFFAEGDTFFASAPPSQRKHCSFSKPGNVAQYALFGRALTRLLIHLCQTETRSELLGWDGKPCLLLRAVFDHDLNGFANQEFYVESLENWLRTSSLRPYLEVNPSFSSVEFHSTEDEISLLLADHLAGCFQSMGRALAVPLCLTSEQIQQLALMYRSIPEVRIEKIDARNFPAEYPFSVGRQSKRAHDVLIGSS